MSIKDQLRELDHVHRTVTPTPPNTQSLRSRVATTDIFAELSRSREAYLPEQNTLPTRIDVDGTLQQLAVDGCFLIEWRLPLSEVIGGLALHDLRSLSAELLAIAGKDDRLATLNLQQTLFIDTETTGLAGGAGTVAFLVGVGHLSVDAFIIRQYFMRDFHEEAALLHHLAQQVDAASGVVSFNGRAFDIPLLNSRCILNRRRTIFDGLPHFDVLFAARRVWRDTVMPCSLAELERSVLGIQRDNDVPGTLVPQIYFEYLQTGKTSGLREVFLHNRQDILSMAALLIRLCRLVEDPLGSTSVIERRRLATLFRKVRHLERSVKVFETLFAKEQAAQSIDTFAELALCYKRLQRYDDARRLWQRAIEQLAFHPLPYIELAKHYEHRLKDFSQAIVLTERALRALTLREQLTTHHETDIYRRDLERRWRRLHRKHFDQEKWRSA